MERVRLVIDDEFRVFRLGRSRYIEPFTEIVANVFCLEITMDVEKTAGRY